MEFRSEIPDKVVFGPAPQTGTSALPRNGLSPVCADSARFLEGPFGETLRSTGLRASQCNWKFSTKYTDQESGWVFYGYRYYITLLARWASRDPSLDLSFLRVTRHVSLNERGALYTSDPYLFSHNEPENRTDPLGLRDTQTYRVRKCQIVIFYGHGWTDFFRGVTFEDCSAATAVTCQSNRILPLFKDNKLPGAVGTDRDTYFGLLKTPERYASCWELYDLNTTAAVTHAKSLLKPPCCCTEVLVTKKCVGTWVECHSPFLAALLADGYFYPPNDLPVHVYTRSDITVR